jgi:hypothetical protein
LTALGDTLVLAARSVGSDGRTLGGAAFVWSSSDPSVAGAGGVRAFGNGHAWVIAAQRDLRDSAAVTVRQRAWEVRVATPVDSIRALGPGPRLTAEVTDRRGHVIADASLTWRSSSPDVLAVDSEGHLEALADGTATITATADGVPHSVDIVVDQGGALLVTLHSAGDGRDPDGVRLFVDDTSLSVVEGVPAVLENLRPRSSPSGWTAWRRTATPPWIAIV